MAPHPIAVALRQFAFSALEELLRKMFSRADDVLFELGERAQSDHERRHYFDTVRVLRLDQARILTRFADTLANRFEKSASAQGHDDAEMEVVNLDELSIQATDELEERIALTNLITRAESMHSQLVYQVERRMDMAIRQLDLPLSPQALSPSQICESFATAVRPLDCDFQIKLIIYKLFEREIIRDLQGIYERILVLLAEYAPQAAAPARRRPSARAADARTSLPPERTLAEKQDEALSAALHTAFGDRVAPAPAYPSATPPLTARYGDPRLGFGMRSEGHYAEPQGLDPRIIELLTRQTTREDTAIADHQLAEALVQALSQPADFEVGGEAAPVVDSGASMQRLSLANQFFDRLLAEPLLPKPARSALERLRFPVIKSALSDPAFFSGSEHPLRTLLVELIDLAVGSALGEAVAPKAFGESIARVTNRADVDARVVSEALAQLRPLEGNELDQFIATLQEQERARRDGLLARVRKLVSQELEIQTLGRAVPDSAQSLLRSGIGPLLAVRLLKHGRNSAPYRDAHELLERVLGMLEKSLTAPPQQPETLATLESLCHSIDDALIGIGMNRERVDTLLHGLREAHTELTHAQEAAASKARPANKITRPAAAPAVTPPSAEAAPPAAEPAAAVAPTLTATPVAAPVDFPTADFQTPDFQTADFILDTVIEDPTISAASEIANPAIAAVQHVVQHDTQITPSGEDRNDALIVAPPELDPSAAAHIDLPQITVAELLSRILTPGSWFRVFDSERRTTRWLKLGSYYPQQDSIGFSGFDEGISLSVRAQRFAMDLAEGRSEPINPDPTAMAALEALRTAIVAD